MLALPLADGIFELLCSEGSGEELLPVLWNGLWGGLVAPGALLPSLGIQGDPVVPLGSTYGAHPGGGCDASYTTASIC